MIRNIWKVAFVISVCVILATAIAAQVQTQTTVQPGEPTQKVQVDRAEVVYVAGNDLVLKTDNGQIEHVVVPNDVTVTVDGKELTVHDLKPGMRLQQTITTTSTPTTVTRVKTVEGTVSHVSPPNLVTLTLGDGTRQRFRIPNGQKFTIDGKETDAFGLRDGMKLSATAITEAPRLLTAQEVARSVQLPPAPATPPMQSALLIAVYGPLASEYAESVHMSGRCH
jgi:hypothetical protein